MKKVISILLAVAVLAFAAPAFAVGNSVANSKNGVNQLKLTANEDLPVFRAGTNIGIRLTGLAEGPLTIITYKCETGTYDDDLTTATGRDNIQYIDQYEISSTDVSNGYFDVIYTVRSTEAGVYYIRMYNAPNTYTAYYRMGDVTVKSVASDGTLAATATPYKIDAIGDGTYSIGFVGKATLGRGDRFEDAGVSLGFKLNGGKFSNYVYNDTISGARIDEYFDDLLANHSTLADRKIEVGGKYSVIYGMTVYNIPDSATAEAITAEAQSDIH